MLDCSMAPMDWTNTYEYVHNIHTYKQTNAYTLAGEFGCVPSGVWIFRLSFQFGAHYYKR